MTLREVMGTLDFWAALLLAASGAAYRFFDRAPEEDAFPVMAMFVVVAMSTVTQRMLSLDDGRSALRYKLWPVGGWKLLLTQDAVFVLLVSALVAPLSLRVGVSGSLVMIALGRFPSLRQKVKQRRGRFVSGDPRYGLLQVVAGAAAGIGAARVGVVVLAIALGGYGVSLALGARWWKRWVME